MFPRVAGNSVTNCSKNESSKKWFTFLQSVPSKLQSVLKRFPFYEKYNMINRQKKHARNDVQYRKEFIL